MPRGIPGPCFVADQILIILFCDVRAWHLWVGLTRRDVSDMPFGTLQDPVPISASSDWVFECTTHYFRRLFASETPVSIPTPLNCVLRFAKMLVERVANKAFDIEVPQIK